MVKTNSFFFPSADGIHSVYACEWVPEGEIRGVVHIVHGLSEYTERYDRFARFLSAQGFIVCGSDHLGHGKTASDKVFGWFAEQDGWHKVLSDVRTMHHLTKEKHPNLPYFFFGHSMGSFLTRQYLIDYPGEVDGAVISGTGQESLTLIVLGRMLARFLTCMGQGRKVNPLTVALSIGAYNKQFKPNRTNVDWISRDEAVQDAYLADPFCRFLPTTGMFADMIGGMHYIGLPKNVARVDKSCPLFLLSGDKDPVGGQGKGVRKTRDLYLRAGCTDVSCKLYPDGRHEMLNELNYEEVHQDVLQWLEAHL
jgi:alpha-beta hydrolase superfamily lysophospholipase